MSTGISIKGIVDQNSAVHHVDHEYLDNNPPIPAIDTSLSTSGAAADAAAVGQAIANVAGTIPEVDDTLSTVGKAADAKATGDALDALKEDLNAIEDIIEGLDSGLSNDAKIALLNCFQHVAWIDEHGQDYYDALEDALSATGRVLVSISAVFDQGQSIIYENDSLDVLRQYLTVVAYYDNGSQTAVTGYTLSGTLAEGISVITATYEGKTSTFSVTVTDAEFSEEWSYPNGNLATQVGSIQRDANSRAAIKTEQVARQSLGAANGTLALNDLSGNPLNIYPIPVPAQANNVRCTFDSSVSGMTLQVMRLEKVEDYYSLSFGTWVESGTDVALANVTANTHIGIVFQTTSSTSARIDSATVVFTHE